MPFVRSLKLVNVFVFFKISAVEAALSIPTGYTYLIELLRGRIVLPPEDVLLWDEPSEEEEGDSTTNSNSTSSQTQSRITQTQLSGVCHSTSGPAACLLDHVVNIKSRQTARNLADGIVSQRLFGDDGSRAEVFSVLNSFLDSHSGLILREIKKS